MIFLLPPFRPLSRHNVLSAGIKMTVIIPNREYLRGLEEVCSGFEDLVCQKVKARQDGHIIHSPDVLGVW